MPQMLLKSKASSLPWQGKFAAMQANPTQIELEEKNFMLKLSLEGMRCNVCRTSSSDKGSSGDKLLPTPSDDKLYIS